MILYNVTVSLDPNIEQEWLNWMRSKHIPDVLETGCFKESRLSRIHGEEEGGVTYSVMYVSPSQVLMDLYQEKFAPVLQQEHSAKYEGKFAAFRTFLTIVEEFHAKS
jgi:hypothetical protein